ncbi:5-formyltetrahydrofolate cyclo-ligase [Rickettsiales bacterium LUAb2]
MNKAQLRKHLSQKIKLNSNRLESLNYSILVNFKLLWHELNIDKSKIIAGYHQLATEANCINILLWLQSQNYQITLPVIKDNNKVLEFKQWFINKPLKKGLLNIYEPVDGQILWPQIIITPMLGFDSTGNRLGHGSAYYDYTLNALKAKNRAYIVIGLAFDFQEVEKITAEEHDVALDIIVTNQGYRFINQVKNVQFS